MSQIDSMSVEQLKFEFSKLNGLTAEIVAAQAAILRRLVAEKVDIADLNVFRLNWLLAIGEGRMLPEVLCDFGGRPNLINKIGSLPIGDQKRLVEGGTIDVAVQDGKGGFSHVTMPPCEMSHGEVSLSLEPGRIVGLAEQKSRLRAKITAVKELAAKVKQIGNMKIDYDRDGVITTISRNGFISANDMRAALRALDAARV